MTKPLATLLIGLCLVAAPACGRKGPLELPPGRAPMAVEGLRAVQRGETVVLEWTNPGKAVSGRPVGLLGSVEIWVFERGLPAAGRAPTSAEVEKTARLCRRIPQKEFASFEVRAGAPGSGMVFPFIFDPGPAGPKSLAFTVRVIDAKGRVSDFAPPVAVELVRKNTFVDRSAAKGVC